MEKLLLVLIVILAVIGIAQIAKVYQLSAQMGNKREEDISPTSNRMNANLILVFMISLFVFFLWQLWAYHDQMLPVAASEHGVKIDRLLGFNWTIIFAVFFIVNFLLFFFTWKFRYNPNRKAFYLAHNNTLELIWTVIPSIVLAVIIIWGLRTWNQIMDEPGEDVMYVELYAKQFDWTARYPGADGKLGESNFTLISGTNPLGLITMDEIDAKIEELNKEIESAETSIETEVLPDSRIEELHDRIGMRSRQKAKVINYRESGMDFSTAHDDKIVKGEFHLPVNKPVNFVIRSRDVIHSAYMPHFRAQMNAVPGMATEFMFTPTITTDSMRTIVGDPDFNFILLCNKVCGSAHFNMQMNIIVESQEDYDAWLSEQKAFVQSEEGAEPEESPEGVQTEVEPIAETN